MTREIYSPKHLHQLAEFVRESNFIENIHRNPLANEIEAHEAVLTAGTLTVPLLCGFVSTVARAHLRDREGMDVYVGEHLAPRGGPEIPFRLDGLLQAITGEQIDPWTGHCRYESLHPFMDGNGRSGRAVWLWHMMRHIGMFPRRAFLHDFYYQTLQHSEGR